MNTRFVFALLYFIQCGFWLHADDSFDLAKQPTCVIGEVAPCGFVNETVNVVDGNLYLRLCHLSVPGHVPLDLIQYYNSQSGYDAWFGKGMGLNYSFWMQGKSDSGKSRDVYGKYEALVAEAPGGSILSCIAKGIEEGSQDYFIDPKVIHNSFTNCAAGHISARSNLKNIRLKERIKEHHADDVYEWTAYLPDGTVKKYKKAENKNDVVNVEKEMRSNKTSLHYEYHKRTFKLSPIKRIEAKAKSKMNWLEFTRSHADREASVTASNGKRATFKAFKKDDGYYIHQIESSDNPLLQFEYIKAGKYYSIDRVVWPEGRFLEMTYDDEGRVISQKAPVGKDDEKRTLWKFDYHSDHTDVRDANNHKKVYRHSDGRITSIEEYKGDALYRSQEYYWGKKEGHSWGKQPKSNEGNLLAYATLNHEKCGMSLCYYDYDDYGNILKETLCGNLTGKYPWAFWIDDEGRPKDQNVERYHKYYTYSADHLLVGQSEDDGPELEYRYIPGTDLMWAKLVRDDDKIIQREFYEYDEDGILIEKIVDDGDSDNKSWFSGVSMRLVTHIQPVKGKEGYGQGLPQDVWENYFDLGASQLVLLKHTHYDYNKAGSPIREAVFDANNTFCYATEYEYDHKGRLHKKKNPLGQIFTYVYDNNNNKTYEKQEDADFHITYEYDKANRCRAVTEYICDGTQVRTSYEYDFMGNTIASTDRYGQTTRYEYDDLNRCTKVILPKTRYITKKRYDIFDNVLVDANAKGAATKYGYTIRKQPCSITYADSSQERFQYNKNGTLHKKWDKNGTQTLYNYDKLGRVRKTLVRDANGTILYQTSNTYSGFHLLSSTDPRGNTTYYRYDGAGRKIEEMLESGNNYSKTVYEYDSLGRLCKTKKFHDKNRSKYSSTRVSYDNLNRPVLEKQQNSAGKCTSWTYYEYDALGNCCLKRSGHTEEDAEVRSVYNSKSELVERIDEYGNTTTISYNHAYIDELGQKTLQKTTTDALGSKTEEYFDILGRCISLIKKSPQGKVVGSTSFRYNATGQKIRQIEQVLVDGQISHEYVISWKYDLLDRLIRLSEQPHTADEKITRYVYDKAGRLQQIIKPDQVVLEHAYDALGRLDKLQASDGTVLYTYSYDRNNNPRMIVDGVSQLVTKRKYDAWNRVIEDGIKNVYKTKMSYDAVGRVSELMLADGSSVQYGYSDTYLRTIQRYSPEGTLVYEHAYTKFDRKNRPTASTLIKDLGSLELVWDKKGRNVSSKSEYYTHTIAAKDFDPVGNLKRYAFTDPQGSAFVKTKYDDLYQVSAESGISEHEYAHDSVHNRRIKDSAVHTVDTQNRLLDDGKSQFIYDKNGNMIEQRCGDSSTYYSYDALDRLVQVRCGEKITRYVYDSFNRRIARGDEYFLYFGLREIGVMQTGALKQLRVLGLGKGAELGASVALELEGKLFCPLHDFRGNIVCLIDAETAEPSESYRYTAFGECEVFTHQPQQFNPWRFASKRFDPETGFVYFSNRFYAPDMGRWVTPDPIGFADGPNRYAYVHNNPLTLFDLYGLFAERDVAERVFTKNGNHVVGNSYVEFGFARDEGVQSAHNAYPTKSCPFSVGSSELSNGSIGHINGIANGKPQAEKGALQLSNMGGGVKVDGIYNKSHSLPIDVFECFLCGFHVMSEPSRLLMEKWNRLAQTMPSDAKFLEISHSGGAVHLRNALKASSVDIQRRIMTLNIAPSVIISNDICYKSANYISKRDFVTHLDVIGKMKYGDELTILEPHPDAPFWDHDFLSPTFDKVKKDAINSYLEQYGDIK